MAGIKDYSTSASANTSINSIDIGEGCAPSGINDAIRQEMADTRSFYESGGWVNLGFTHTYASATSVTVSGTDVTSYYPAGRRIKAAGTSTGTIYGKVASSSFSTNTTINFTWDSGTLANETLTVYASFLTSTGTPSGATGNMVNTGVSVSGHIPKYTDTTGLALADGYGVDTDGTLAANSDSNVATQKAVKTYVDGKAGGGVFKNFLINADFSNLVNQRGYASGAATGGANQYTFDRWRVVTSGQNVSWSGGTVTCPAGGLAQTIEGALIPKTGTYTISWTGSATCTVDGVSKASGGTFTLTSGSNSVIIFSSGTLSYPQVEYGSAATSFEYLPLDIIVYRCQRFFEKSYALGTAPATATNTGAIFSYFSTAPNATQLMGITWKVRKRTSPTVTFYSPVSGTSGQARFQGAGDKAVGYGNAGEWGTDFYQNSGGTISSDYMYVHFTASAEL